MQDFEKINLHLSPELPILHIYCSNACFPFCSINPLSTLINQLAFIIASASNNHPQPPEISILRRRISSFLIILSQTISTSFLVRPFTPSFFLIAKGSIIQKIRNSNRSTISTYLPLVKTQLWNFLLILSTNATFFSIIFFIFNILDALGLQSSNMLLIISAASAVLYSIMLACMATICNLALILLGSETKGGYMAILRACVFIKRRTATAMSLMMAINIAQLPLEALFQYRIVTAYYHSETSFSGLAYETMLIAYLYALVLVLDTIIGFVFFQSCNSSGTYSCVIQVEEKDVNPIVRSMTVDEFPYILFPFLWTKDQINHCFYTLIKTRIFIQQPFLSE